MAETISHCPNCGTEWPTGAEACPHCGYRRSDLASWPPTPEGFITPPLPPEPRLVTGKAWGDMTLGVGITFASFIPYCLGMLVMPILYFTLRRNYPYFGRGIGYGLLVGFVVLAGALAWCLSSLSNWRGL